MFDYLNPSADLASAHADEFGITEIDRVQLLITEHHRLRPSDDRMTESFRKADLIDVSRGVLRGQIRRSTVQAVVAQLPCRGFHAFLAKGLIPYAARHPLAPSRCSAGSQDWFTPRQRWQPAAAMSPAVGRGRRRVWPAAS